MTYLAALITMFFRLFITPVKPGPAAIGDPVNGIYGLSGAIPNQAALGVILNALQNNASPVFGNWSTTLIPASLTAYTIPAGNLVSGIIRRFNPGAAFTDSTDTATNIVNAIPGAVVGQTFPLLIANMGSGLVGAMTVAGGAGVTVTGTATIATGFLRLFLGQVTGSSTVSLTSCFTFFGGTSGAL